MLKWNLVVVLLVLLKVHDYQGCSSSKKENLLTPRDYDLNNPEVIQLPSQLNEISGISYYPKDSSVFAIVDEDGLLFKIHLRNPPDVKFWRFDKKHDFEDVVLHDSIFYVLISNGDIETLRFSNDTVHTNKKIFENADKKTNEFETLYFDDKYNQLVMLCKDCEDDKKKIVTAWGFNPDSAVYTPSLFSIDVKPVAEKTKEEKLHLKPSAAAVNPVNGDVYILASVNKLLLISDRSGKVKEVFELDPSVYKQPEGITFTPTGDMIISNESHEEGNATLLFIKHKPKDK
ncbi:MAG: SdiA-regulated domain-containing protein [Chitinophagaceae bacterium]|nr:SdiA-regulated domain-containing protein [Chitinophagaceae bacterium]